MNEQGSWRWVMVVVCGLSCTPTQNNEAEELTNTEAAAVCGVWAPTWRQGSGATTQWVEWVIQGNAGVKAVWLEAAGQELALAPLDGGWGVATSVPAGTQMVLHARTDDDEEAQTLPFGYLTTPEPTTDPSACASACIAPWDPLWQQGTTANNYWMDWTISRGTVTSVSIEVVGGATTQLSHGMGRWTATVPGGITTGTPVILHATDASGRTARTLPFAYLRNAQPPTSSCGGTGPTRRCPSLPAGMVTLSLDDGFAAQVTLARNELAAHQMKASIFLISGAIGNWKDYLSLGQARELVADGHEIGSHTVNHPNVATLDEKGREEQLHSSKEWLEKHLGVTIRHFVTPYGSYNDDVIDTAKRHYATHGTVDIGLNFPGEDLYRLRRFTVRANTTTAELRSRILDAKANRGWLILLFHDFIVGPPKNIDAYDIADFKTVLDDLAASGLEVVTMDQGVARMGCP